MTTRQPGFAELLAYAPPPALLDGRVIVITGAAAGIGRAVANAAARLGATIIALDKDAAGLRSLQDDLKRAGTPTPTLEVMDLATATTADYRQLAERIGDQHGRLDSLVNNAGAIGALTPFEHVEPQVFGQVLAINLVAPFFLTQWCLPLLRRAADPTLIFSLQRADRAFWGPFGVAKAGQEALLHIVADEYHPASAAPIRVLGIDPGPVASADRQRHYPGENQQDLPQPTAVTGPYLYALGPASRGLSNVVLRTAP